MASVLPAIPGLDINGLIYRYTTVKNAKDDMLVHIGNKNASGEGYTFRETDDWSGVAGNTITKSFSLNNIPLANWGDGSIEVEGSGSIKDAVVIYSFRVDECYDGQSNPACPNYIKPIPVTPEIEIYAALDDKAVLDAIDTETNFEYDEDGNLILSEKDEEDDEDRLELGLMASANALTMFKTKGQSEIINSMNGKTNLAMYYNSSINGGIYNDNAQLVDSRILDNKKALRNNWAQQILHTKMVDMQYNK